MPGLRILREALQRLGAKADEETDEVLVEESPPKRRFWRLRYPSLSHIQATSCAQSGVQFFRLPPEIREQIYVLLCRDAGLAQHIIIHHGGYTHTQCITDYAAPDSRQAEIDRLFHDRLEHHGFLSNELWDRRLKSSWVNHWQCQEKAASSVKSEVAPFLAMMLTCKRLYLDCRTSIYSKVTFTITSLSTAYDLFVARGRSASCHFQNLAFTFNLPESNQDPIDQDPIIQGYGYPAELDNLVFGKDISLWYSLCNALAECPAVRQVSFWLDTLDPRFRRRIARDPELFMFPPQLASKATINVPVDTQDELQRLRDAVPPALTVIGRPYPRYHGNSFGITTDEFAPWQDIMGRIGTTNRSSHHQ